MKRLTVIAVSAALAIASLLCDNAHALGFITVSGGYVNAGNGSTGGSGGGSTPGGGSGSAVSKGCASFFGTAVTSTTVTTVACTTQATGSTFLLEVNNHSVGAPSTIVDTKGNAWTQAQTNPYGGTLESTFYYCLNCTGGAGFTVTATYASAPIASILFLELENVGAGTIDQNPASFFDSTGSPVAAPSVTTTVANEIVVSAYANNSNNAQTITDSGPGFSITTLQNTTNGTNGAISWAVPVASATTTSDTFQYSIQATAVAFTLSIKPAGSGGGTTGGGGTITTGVWANVTPSNINLTSPINSNCNSYGLQTVQADPNNPGTLYAEANCQGIWKSADYGQTWAGPINTGLNGTTVSDCAGGITLLPVGSVPTIVESCIRGAATGFWRSTNGGVDWTNYNIGPLPAGHQDVYPPSVDPYNPQHLLMNGHEQNYLVESFNGGLTWSNITFNAGMLEPNGTAFTFFIDTGNATTTANTYLWEAQQSGGTYGTWRTTNDGATWTMVSRNEHPHGAFQAYQPPGSSIVYIAGAYAPTWGVQRSADYGQTWTSVGAGSNETVVFGDSNTVYAGYGWAEALVANVPPTFELAVQPGTGSWSQPGTPAGMSDGGFAQVAVVNNGTNNILVGAMWGGGIWRYVETPGSGTSPSPVNGVVGPANGTAVTSAPTTGLCISGTATAVSGSGPWTWTCQGANGGSSQNGSAPVASGGTGDFAPNGYVLKFADNFATFNGNATGTNGWMTVNPGAGRTNNGPLEAECYMDPSVGFNPFSIIGGPALQIQATVGPTSGSNPCGTAANYPYYSGIIASFNSFYMQYGYFVMKAKMPSCSGNWCAGLWPAFWMLPEDNGWPPEIDVVEQVLSATTIYNTIHYGANNSYAQTTDSVANTTTGYHIYAVDWEPTTITFYFDGVQQGQPLATQPGMNVPMYILANMAVGGPGSWPGQPTSPSTEFPANYDIQFIRAYASPNSINIGGALHQ